MKIAFIYTSPLRNLTFIAFSKYIKYVIHILYLYETSSHASLLLLYIIIHISQIIILSYLQYHFHTHLSYLNKYYNMFFRQTHTYTYYHRFKFTY